MEIAPPGTAEAEIAFLRQRIVALEKQVASQQRIIAVMRRERVKAGEEPHDGHRGGPTVSQLFTPEQVRAIRDDRRSLRRIGADYGISYEAVRLIKERKNYRDIE